VVRRDHRQVKQEFPALAARLAARRLGVAAGLRRARGPARPVVTAMMPPVPWRPYLIDLLRSPLPSGEIAPFTAGATVYGDPGVVPPAGQGPVPVHLAVPAS